MSRHTEEQFRALFEPRGVVIAGASSHPGKFGFVSLHNLLAGGYEGKVFATNLDGIEVLGVQTVASVDDIPDGEADLLFMCTPKGAVPSLLRAAAAKGIRAAFLTSAGYGEGIQWRGDVSAGATVEIQFAQSVGQTFLGINLKCASCHDSFIDRWKLEESFGLAAIFATKPLEIHRCDKPIGKQAQASWLFPAQNCPDVFYKGRFL